MAKLDKRTLLLMVEDLFMATARLTTWMSEEHRGSGSQYDRLMEVRDCLVAVERRLNDFRDENGCL